MNLKELLTLERAIFCKREVYRSTDNDSWNFESDDCAITDTHGVLDIIDVDNWEYAQEKVEVKLLSVYESDGVKAVVTAIGSNEILIADEWVEIKEFNEIWTLI